jgi:hypothetical protein
VFFEVDQLVLKGMLECFPARFISRNFLVNQPFDFIVEGFHPVYDRRQAGFARFDAQLAVVADVDGGDRFVQALEKFLEFARVEEIIRAERIHFLTLRCWTNWIRRSGPGSTRDSMNLARLCSLIPSRAALV